MLPDNDDLFFAHDAEQEAWLRKRPVCICCGEHIQEEMAHQINGEYWCDKCLDDTRVYIED